jgi:hypothetical protein
MHTKVDTTLGFNLTKKIGHCFSMENKQVPLIEKIKDAQFTFAIHLEKKINMIVLVADVIASYGILLR